MSIHRVVPNIPTTEMRKSRHFYVELLGFRVLMDMDWIVTLGSSEVSAAQISLVRSEDEPRGNDRLTLTIEVDDVDGLYEKAKSQQREIIYPLTREPWGVLRFHVVDPNGVVVNVMCHLNETPDT